MDLVLERIKLAALRQWVRDLSICLSPVYFIVAKRLRQQPLHHFLSIMLYALPYTMQCHRAFSVYYQRVFCCKADLSLLRYLFTYLPFYLSGWNHRFLFYSLHYHLLLIYSGPQIAPGSANGSPFDPPPMFLYRDSTFP